MRAWYAGVVRQVTGAYNIAWVTAALLCLIAAVLMFAFPARTARREAVPVDAAY